MGRTRLAVFRDLFLPRVQDQQCDVWGHGCARKLSSPAADAGTTGRGHPCERETYVFRHPGPPGELFQTFKQFYGPTMNAFEAASKDERADQLEAELTRLFEQYNRASADRTEIPATFLKVTVTKH